MKTTIRAIEPKEERVPRSERQRPSLAATASTPLSGEDTELSLAEAPPPQPQGVAEVTAGLAPTAVSPSVPSPVALAARFTAVLVAVDHRGQGWIRRSNDVLASAATPAANARTQPRCSTIALALEHVGRELLVCRAGTSARAGIVGVGSPPADTEPCADPSVDLVAERRRIDTQLVLGCGDGNITLAADGKVIRGMGVLSSATRTQRIRGGAVRINRSLCRPRSHFKDASACR